MNEEMIELAITLYGEGKSYGDIVEIIYDKYGYMPHVDTVRYHVKRKHLPKVTLKEKLAEDGITKTLVLSDLHCPYHRGDILEIVERHKDEIDTLILGGDIIDCYAISSYPTLEPRPLVTEMHGCYMLLKSIQDIIPNVKKIIVKGNHELRWEKYLGKVKSELNKLHSDNILREIVKGFEIHDRQAGIHSKYDELDYEVIDEWYYQKGDIIVCHPLSFSKVAAKTAEMALDYFVERGLDFSSVLIAHTHKISSCYKYGKHAIEIGCCCKPQEYANSGKLTYTQQCNGYYLATFKDGKFDINQSRNFVLEGEAES